MVPETLNVGPTTAGARTSTIVRLYWSPVGAVSLMDTDVPASGVALLCRWTQYVSPTGGRYEWTSTCPAAGVRMIGLSKSFPTPSTHELFRVVTRVAVGAPELPLPEPVAPIAPEPFVPDVSTPVKLTIVTEDATLCERVARTVAFVRYRRCEGAPDFRRALLYVRASHEHPGQASTRHACDCRVGSRPVVSGHEGEKQFVGGRRRETAGRRRRTRCALVPGDRDIN